MKTAHRLSSSTLGLTLLVSVAIGIGASAADSPRGTKGEARRAAGHTPAQTMVVAPADQTYPKSRATTWVVYDDGSREKWASTHLVGTDSAGADAAGNKFTSTWGTFYCDMVSMYMRFTGAQPTGFMSAWNGLAGSTLQNVSYISISPGTTTGWIQADGSGTAIGWVGNPTYLFNNTAWIGADFTTTPPRGVSGIVDLGLDTAGPSPYHGFSVTNYIGTGYVEDSWNAMVRARFNGDNVPVELMSFSAE